MMTHIGVSDDMCACVSVCAYAKLCVGTSPKHCTNATTITSSTTSIIMTFTNTNTTTHMFTTAATPTATCLSLLSFMQLETRKLALNLNFHRRGSDDK